VCARLSVHVCVPKCVRVCECMCARVCMCMRACVYACACVRAFVCSVSLGRGLALSHVRAACHCLPAAGRGQRSHCCVQRSLCPYPCSLTMLHAALRGAVALTRT